MAKNNFLIQRVDKLVDRLPYLDNDKYVEVWEHEVFFLGRRIKHKKSEKVRRIRNNDFTITNNSFDFLKGSNAFLNLLLNNINSCILMLNKDTRLMAFNDNLKTIFSNKKDENLIYRRCGEAIGCAYQIEQQKECGSTSMCDDCELRSALLQTYNTNENIYRENIIRPFFDTNNTKIMKHLQFSTHQFLYHKDKYVIMLIGDVSRFYEENIVA